MELARLVQEAVQVMRDGDGDRGGAELLAQLDQQLSASLNAGQLPKEVERKRLQAIMQALHRALPGGGVPVDFKTNHNGRVSVGGEIILVATEDSQGLIPALRVAGFRVRRLSTLTEVRATVAQTTPVAALVDMDCDEGSLLAGINMIAKGNDRVDFNSPVFFISERSDLMARLEAVSAGGQGYFTKPIDVPLLLEALKGRLGRELLQGRVLIVADTSKEAREMALVLEARGMVTQTVDQPMEVVHCLYRFRPDLILLDLNLREVNGLELAKAVRQYSDFDPTPIILISAQSDVNHRLTALAVGIDDLLGKPVVADCLVKTVSGRLRRTQIFHQKLARLNQKETISGLYHRRYFLTQLQRLLAEVGNDNSSVALMLITLDNLRAMAGRDVVSFDHVVEQAAGRLRASLAPGQLAARFSDTIFTVLCDTAEREKLLDSALKVRIALEANPYWVAGEPIRLRTSIGISIAEKGQRHVQSLIQQADLACSSAWVAGGEHIQIYHPQANPKVQASQQKSLLEDIHDAVQQQRMNLVFQPIVSMQGDPAERYEVLLRMYKEGEEILPETVFGLTQRHRLGMVLDRWVIGQSIRVLRERQSRIQATTLFVNVSPAVLRDEEFANWLKAGLEKTGVPAGRLVLEMTEETAEQNLQVLREFLEKVRPLGCGFSLDRFSGSEKSLELLKKIPVNYVKLDAHFAKDLAENRQKQQQLKNLAQELSALGLTTIAGNIEKLPTLFALWSCGVNYVQGFFLQQPHAEMNYDFTSGAF
jgi:diguanylate cyclase (GGDEF)-like protein